jgi:hypothetical protein
MRNSKVFIDRAKLKGSASKYKGQNTDKSLKKNKRIDKKFIILFSLIIVIITLFSSSIYFLIKQNQYQNNLLSRITEIIDQNNQCRVLNKDQASFLNFYFDENGKIINFNLSIYKKSNLYINNLMNLNFRLDNQGNIGNISDYFDINKYFSNKEQLYKSISSRISRELKVKIDFTFSIEGLSSLEELKNYNDDFYNYLFSGSNHTFKIISSVCKKDVQSILQDKSNFFTKRNMLELRGSRLDNSLLTIEEVKFEQLRVHIDNRTGVESYGEIFKEYLSNYGINVVKIDYASQMQKESEILIIDSYINDTDTFKQLMYLTDGRLRISQDDNINIFSDIYIVLGEDSMII